MIRITGRVRRRPEGTLNPNLPTGEVEVLGHTLEILNKARTPPFQLDDENVQDDIRLRYRYVDLRRGNHAGKHQTAQPGYPGHPRLS